MQHPPVGQTVRGAAPRLNQGQEHAAHILGSFSSQAAVIAGENVPRVLGALLLTLAPHAQAHQTDQDDKTAADSKPHDGVCKGGREIWSANMKRPK